MNLLIRLDKLGTSNVFGGQHEMVDASATTTPYWLPIVTAFAGLASGVLIEWFRDARAYARERETRIAGRKDMLLDRRITFQRQTLLDLQGAIVNLVQAHLETHSHDVQNNQCANQWKELNHPTELIERISSARSQVLTLRSRVNDDSVREISGDLLTTCSNLYLSKSVQDGNEHSSSLIKIQFKLNDCVGEVLRKLDSDASILG
jgi:hypothetical protein